MFSARLHVTLQLQERTQTADQAAHQCYPGSGLQRRLEVHPTPDGGKGEGEVSDSCNMLVGDRLSIIIEGFNEAFICLLLRLKLCIFLIDGAGQLMNLNMKD
jgi:hypothetical protein